MKFGEKLEILIARSGMSKTDFADEMGITYRSIANYVSGARMPKADILYKMALKLGVKSDFLLDDNKNLQLTSEEQFMRNAGIDNKSRSEASEFLNRSRGLFAGNNLTEDDKEALFECLQEIYFDAKDNAKKYGRKKKARR